MIGKEISQTLSELEDALWEFECSDGLKPGFTTDGFRAATKIFMCVMLDKMYELQEDEGIDMKHRMEMAEKCGNDVRRLIKTYTDIDTHELYK